MNEPTSTNTNGQGEPSTVPAKPENEKRILRGAPQPKGLAAEALRFQIPLDESFSTSSQITERDGTAGQERAFAALEMGTGIPGNGYNVYVTGLTGSERLAFLQSWLSDRSAGSPTPGDWLYLSNFKNPDKPIALYLNAGEGRRLRQMMQGLVRTLRQELPKAFRQEAFDREKHILKEKYEARSVKMKTDFEEFAKGKGFVVSAAENGNIFLIPIIDGKPLESPDDFAKIPEEKRKEISGHQEEVVHQMEKLARGQQELIREMEADIRNIEREFCRKLLSPLISDIESKIPNAALSAWVSQVSDHILDHLEDFKEQQPQAGPFAFLQGSGGAEKDPFIDYEVNVAVDNTDQKGAPVIVEEAPTYLNLFGTIERVVDRFGRLVTNFTRIKPGSILKAHGGYLIFNLEDAVTEPAVWKTLKRTIRSGKIEMETYEPFALFSTSGLKPESITVNTKLIVAGPAYLYHLLFNYDEEFRNLFKVHADFRSAIEASPEHIRSFVTLISETCREEELPHFDRSAVGRLLLHAARRAEDRERIVSEPAEIRDLVREASWQAKKENASLVLERHVQAALDHRVFRSNRYEEDLRRLVKEGTILLEIEGKRIGQVNGLAVIDIGGYSFGRPSRVTAAASMGTAGIINIERESNMSGNIHNKGMFILAGWMRNTFGQEKPIALSASVCFEQSYSGIDGDSASSTEIYALLSRLSDIPIRQDIAVTGSVNQWGEVQAIGGVNEKVEGFFDLCRIQGLTGTQGVMIPFSNVRHLILRSDVIKAVEQNSFHIYPVSSIDEGIQILTGVRAGKPGEEGSVYNEVSRRLTRYLEGLNEQTGSKDKGAHKASEGAPI